MSNKKDAYYFSHDCNARHDPKLLEMVSEFSMLGYAWYFVIIEILREQNNYKYPKKLLGALAIECQTDSKSMAKFLEKALDIGLLECDDTDFWSDSLMKRMAHLDDKRVKRSLAGKRGAESLWQTHDKRIAKDDKVNESKVNENKPKENKSLIEPPAPKKPEKLPYSEFVFMTSDEYGKLLDEYGPPKTQEMIDRLNDYIGSKGAKYRSHYHTIKNWIRKDGPQGGLKISRVGQEKLNILANVKAIREAQKG